MSDRTNDEKLKILQERLAQIKEKSETTLAAKREESNQIPSPEFETLQEKEIPRSFNWLKYSLIIFAIGYGSFYTYNNINFSDAFSSDEKIEEVKEFVLEYNFNFSGEDKELKNIAITASFEDEILAKAMVNDLKVKGYKCDYFFLPNKSNSTKEVYKVFIGPYENIEETNQWTKNLKGTFEIITL